MECEIILIGNELLIGKTVDANGQWLIAQTRPLGIKISRIVIIGDIVEEIRSTISEAISRSPDFIITSGGLGPTFDDMTLQGIASGLIPPKTLKLDTIALSMIRDRYRKIFNDQDTQDLLTPSRKKMAIIPEGSIPLSNSEGTAPGVYIPDQGTNKKTGIYCLPGVPRELKAIFITHILPALEKKVQGRTFYECGFVFSELGESKFSESVFGIVNKNEYPEIWIKTHPRGKETKEVELHSRVSAKIPISPDK